MRYRNVRFAGEILEHDALYRKSRYDVMFTAPFTINHMKVMYIYGFFCT
jgi:hypothetical protein